MKLIYSLRSLRLFANSAVYFLTAKYAKKRKEKAEKYNKKTEKHIKRGITKGE